MKNVKLLFILVAISAISCTKKVYIDRVEYQKGKDSVHIQIRDSIIYIDSPMQRQDVITNQKSCLYTDYSFSLAWVDTVGLLHHSIQNNPRLPMKIQYVDKYRLKTDSIIKKESQIVEKKVEVPYIPWKAWLGWALLGLGIVWKFRKFIGIAI